jgi:hypothetical protein
MPGAPHAGARLARAYATGMRAMRLGLIALIAILPLARNGGGADGRKFRGGRGGRLALFHRSGDGRCVHGPGDAPAEGDRRFARMTGASAPTTMAGSSRCGWTCPRARQKAQAGCAWSCGAIRSGISYICGPAARGCPGSITRRVRGRPGLGGGAPALRRPSGPPARCWRGCRRRTRLTSLGVVAYGRDHAARIDVAEVGFY